MTRAGREDGFTLVELLVSISILGLLMSAMTMSIIVGLRTTDGTSRRLAESHDAQLVQVWFPNDVESATDVSTSDTTCAGATPVVRLRWTDGGVTKVASYVVQTVGVERRLVRAYCENGASVSSTTVAHHMAATGPTLACAPAACSTTPRTVAVTVTEEDGYAFTVSATRRPS